jgi:hypothetical protein
LHAPPYCSRLHARLKDEADEANRANNRKPVADKLLQPQRPRPKPRKLDVALRPKRRVP